MRKLIRNLISLIFTMIFLIQVPVYAGTFNLGGYVPPNPAPQGQEAITQDANNFMRVYYGLPTAGGDYYTPTTLVKDSSGNVVSSPLRLQEDYNISDIDAGPGGVSAPILYYEKAGGGPERDKQYLGQTIDGYTITNVRYPLSVSWSFMEELPWLPYGDKEAQKWWLKQNNPLPEVYEVNDKAQSDPEFAAMLDFCIGAAIIPQLRHWNGQQYYISKAMADTSGNPGQPGGDIKFRAEVATDFPWHQYVNVLQSPTFNTWGYGIGFFYLNGAYHYKSFPITPLRMALVPDFYPTPEGETTWRPEFKVCAKTYSDLVPGTVHNTPVRLYNAGETAITDFAATWFNSSNGQDPRSEGWVRPAWKVENINIGKGEYREFIVPVTVPQPGEESRLVFLSNVNKKTPANEIKQDNNMMIIDYGTNINLAAVSINSGVTGSPVLGKRYTGKVIFKNTTGSSLFSVPIGAFNNGYRATLIDAYGQAVTQADFGPNESKSFTFQWTLPTSIGSSYLEGVINVAPLPLIYREQNYMDNKVHTIVAAPVGGGGNQELTFQAWRQYSYLDVMGKPKEYRKPNTARYTDIVETTLTPTNIKKVQYTVNQGDYVDYTTTIAPPVPTCGGSCGSWNTLTDWKITKATLHYPAKSEGFSFGHPFWDNDWTSIQMKPQGKTAREKFKEEWAMDGAPVFDRIKNDFVGPPKNYTLRANYTIQVTYDQTCGHLVCKKDDCWCEYTTTKGLTATFNYTGTGKILIDGTGVAPVPTQYVREFKDVYPHLVVKPY